MDRLKMHSVNKVDENIKKIAELFPNTLTEVIKGYREDGTPIIEHAIDFDVLRQELSNIIVEGPEERYQFTWPDKKKSILLANAPIAKTLRPCREESVDFDTTENLYIEGDNLDVLKLLQETYLGKVKMIYIDPPYNTGKDFIYEDDFAQSTEEYLANSGQYDEDGNRLVPNLESNGRFHTDWLNMMYPRLKLAKDLLSDDGVIFISIDDNELENLRKICLEVFGISNFIAQIIHKNNSMKNQSKLIGVTTEYMLIYAKNREMLRNTVWRVPKKAAADINNKFKQLKAKGLSLQEIEQEIKEMYTRPKYAHLSRWNKVDENGVFKDADLSREGGHKDFTIINPNTGKPCVIPKRGWGKSQQELLRLQAEGLIWYGDDTTPPGLKDYLNSDDVSVPDNFWYFDNSVDTRWIKSTFGRLVFENPKPLEFIKQAILLHTKESDIILDFFSGSATTAHAVMQLNAEDGGNRKFIMVQFPEKTPENSEAHKAGYHNICEIGKERIRRAGKKILEKHPEAAGKLDIGFRVLKVASSNMQDVYYRPDEYTQDLLSALTDNIKPDRTPEDLLFQVMLDLGVLLSSKIEETVIGGKKVFNVAEGYLMACFDNDVTDEVVKEIAKRQPYYAVFRDSGMASDSVATNFEQIFETYSPSTVRKVL
ncbi:MAG: site-specific DNA-methyltransferase [Clostridiales bacterium]|nr:site-specific DNA-methyltransferase [Clostridiales bacterium]